MRRFRWVALALVLLMFGATGALAEKRIALLIGNKDYKPGVGALVNPLNDVRLMGEALKAVGFEVLKPAQNAKRADMLIAIHDFASRLKGAGADAVGFLYYSGHGIASAGENYLVPVDIDEPSTVLLSVQGVKQSEVLAILRNEAPNAAHYLVLDACRNTLQGARGGKGFLPVGQQSGVLVAFAAEPGKTASDTGHGSGPYAAALAAELVKPGQNDLLMFHRVRVAVMDKTNGDQVPWTEDGIQRRERVLFGGEVKPSGSVIPPTSGPARLSEGAEAWDRTKDSTSIAALELFISRYKDTYYAGLALLRIEELKKKQAAVAAPTKAPSPPPPTPAIGGLRQDDPERLMPNKFQIQQGFEVTGKSAGSTTVQTLEQCRDYCGRTAKCRAFTFRHQGGACFWYESGKLQANSYYTSGVATSIAPSLDNGLGTGREKALGEFQIREGIEVTGKSAGSTTVQTLEQCRDYCGRTAKCRAFTFRHEVGACFWYESGKLQANSHYTSGLR
jgi:hypothetical protein